MALRFILWRMIRLFVRMDGDTLALLLARSLRSA